MKKSLTRQEIAFLKNDLNLDRVIQRANGEIHAI